ncbi:hypothetical protein BD560DRAFT_104458 [Blakeslea trispora]|nr:hypothetical protein BD560DRAFT_104458 [Blakeslea trispora]
MMTEEPEPVVQSKIEEITTLLQKDLDLSPPPRPRFVPDTTQHITNKKIDPLKTGANLIKINKDNVTANTLTPREQEKEDEQVIQGLGYLFDNQFMAAKNLFEEKSN